VHICTHPLTLYSQVHLCTTYFPLFAVCSAYLHTPCAHILKLYSVLISALLTRYRQLTMNLNAATKYIQQRASLTHCFLSKQYIYIYIHICTAQVHLSSAQSLCIWSQPSHGAHQQRPGTAADISAQVYKSSNITYDIVNITYDTVNITYETVNITYDIVNITYDKVNITYDTVNITYDIVNITYDKVNITYDIVNSCA